MLKHRYGVRHQNIINVLGIDSSFSPHPGLVLEHCPSGNLTTVSAPTMGLYKPAFDVDLICSIANKIDWILTLLLVLHRPEQMHIVW